MLNQIWNFFVTDPNASLAIAPLLLAALIGAGTGLISNRAKQDEADKERQYEAVTARWSPWTKLSSHYVANPNMASDVLGGAAAGLSFGAANQGLFGGGAADSAPAAAEGMEGVNYAGMSGVGPVSNGQVYANSMNKSFGPYRNGSLYSAMLDWNKAPR